MLDLCFLSIVLIVIKKRLNMVNMKKRMRLHSRNDEDYESPASLPITSSNLASYSVKKDRQEQEERRIRRRM